MMEMESGYPREIFVEPIDSYLLCSVCDRVLRSPRATPCGHVFCCGCIERWVSEFGVCPQRCRELEPRALTRAVHIETRISGLRVRCQNYNSGCIVQLPLREKHKHEQSCPLVHIIGLGHPAQQDDPNRKAEENCRDHPVDEKEGIGFFERTKLVLSSFRSAKSSRRPCAPPATASTAPAPCADSQQVNPSVDLANIRLHWPLAKRS